jgi:hypothetical protein
MNLRPHQIEKGNQLADVLKRYNIAYLNGEVRSGKTLTALYACDVAKANSVLIITKKKAIPSIVKDYNAFGFNYAFTAINYESVHKLNNTIFDVVIYDESHSLGAFPKPSKRTKLLKKMFSKVPTILMTGTPAVESGSQLYHQFYVSDFSPFKQYKNFYRWADVFVNKKELRLPTHTVVDYSKAKTDKIIPIIEPYMVTMTQADANFETNLNEQILKTKLPEAIKNLCDKLIQDKAIEGKTGFILGDTPAKLQSKLHQLYNGTCIIETASGNTFTHIFDNYKALFIKQYFSGQKIAILYYYQAELEVLKSVFDITTDLEEFNNSDKTFALQQSSSEGMNLSKADALVFYNIGFSGKNYLQARDRMTIKGRKDNNVYFVCEIGGITEKILKAVRNKKNYNSQMFKRDYGKY